MSDELDWKLEKLSFDQFGRDTARYSAATGDGRQPFLIRVRVTKDKTTKKLKTFFVVFQGAQHYTTVRSLERAKAVAQKIHDQNRQREEAARLAALEIQK
jgi:hypothetical protein